MQQLVVVVVLFLFPGGWPPAHDGCFSAWVCSVWGCVFATGCGGVENMVVGGVCWCVVGCLGQRV